jgi:hypothetical protein
MPPVGFEPMIPASARPQTYALDCVATDIGSLRCSDLIQGENGAFGERNVMSKVLQTTDFLKIIPYKMKS